MRATNRLLAAPSLVISLVVAGCASNSAPRSFLPEPATAERWAHGGWLELDIRSDSGGVTQKLSGELLAITADSLWIDAWTSVDTSLRQGYVVARRSIAGHLTRYDWGPMGTATAGYTVGGVLLTASNGWFLLLTAPAWIITGSVAGAVDSFSARAMALDLKAAYGRMARPSGSGRALGVCYFFPRPSKGSACKRLNLFLRWMVRRDALDLGVWRRVSPAKLVVPLDTHVIRVGRCLRLTRYTSPGWRMARDITASLRALDADDPVKYDFALCHLGMMNACGFKQAQADSQCPLRGLCRPRVRARRRAAR